MNQKSSSMNLRSSELSRLPWFGATGKIVLEWACHLNRNHNPAIGQTYEDIATTRVCTNVKSSVHTNQHLDARTKAIGPADDTIIDIAAPISGWWCGFAGILRDSTDLVRVTANPLYALVRQFQASRTHA